jgi:hypothetical protein
MVSFTVKPSKPSRPSWTGRKKMDGFKPLLSKGYTRLFQPVQFLAFFGRVKTHTQQRFYPSTINGRPTDVCRFRAA